MFHVCSVPCEFNLSWESSLDSSSGLSCLVQWHRSFEVFFFNLISLQKRQEQMDSCSHAISIVGSFNVGLASTSARLKRPPLHQPAGGFFTAQHFLSSAQTRFPLWNLCRDIRNLVVESFNSFSQMDLSYLQGQCHPNLCVSVEVLGFAMLANVLLMPKWKETSFILVALSFSWFPYRREHFIRVYFCLLDFSAECFVWFTYKTEATLGI